ncbi:hypothetical protein [Colwellia sp. PAMC 21821]|uniref:hypothetical protein n=1 Tax=Colwellia sp. PAMC 21821 TaxID=1816219 RepID=UPI0009C09D27|nr:hypothetical protein [Colwellia sp. PAMC 21821]ARD45813.1 hypothetical protein A3Q33_16880 [Colwellia sp. PAMC 21821]
MNMTSVLLLKTLLIIVTFTVIMIPGKVSAASSVDVTGDGIYVQTVDSDKWSKVSDSQLAYSRGGFILPNGVIVNISFEKRIFQNGEEIASSYFKTPNSRNIVQNGKLNVPGLSSSLFQSIIQNDLDNQTLQTINNINIDIKNLNNINLTPNNNQFYNLHSICTHCL